MRFFNEKIEFDAAYLATKEANKQYLDKHIAIVEELHIAKKHLPFFINNISENGFVIKTCGLYAFISFYHMPWYYPDKEYWKVISSKIMRKIFFGEIYHYDKESLSIMLNGTVPQFKKMELIENVNYTGIILRKTDSYMIIDIGFNFGWDCGSFIGILYKPKFNYCYYDTDYTEGNEIEVKYYGVKENGKAEFSKENDIDFWDSEEAKSLIGTIVDTRVVKRCEQNEYWVNDKYRAVLPLNNHFYKDQLKELTKQNAELKNGDIVQCELHSINKQSKQFVLKCKPKPNYELELAEAIKNLVGTDILVIVKKEERKYSVLIDGKYEAMFPFNKTIYPGQDRKQIQQKFNSINDGTPLECKVMSYDSRHSCFILRWNKYSHPPVKPERNAAFHRYEKIKEPIIRNSIINIIDDKTYSKLLALLNDDSIENIEHNA